MHGHSVDWTCCELAVRLNLTRALTSGSAGLCQRQEVSGGGAVLGVHSGARTYARQEPPARTWHETCPMFENETHAHAHVRAIVLTYGHVYASTRTEN